MPVTTITREQAVDALRKNAWDHKQWDDVEVTKEMRHHLMDALTTVVDDEQLRPTIVDAVERALASPPPRWRIHTFAGSIGCDWDLDEAVAFAEKSSECAWVDSPLRHDLVIVSNDRAISFDAPRPERRG